MKTAVFRNKQKIEIVEKSKPEPKAGEVLLKVAYCGICGSDVHAFHHGSLIPPDTVMGHECSGTVAQTGEGVSHVKPGDRVVVKPIAQCGLCYWCANGRYSLCPTAHERALGIAEGNDGAFADYLLLRYPNEMLLRLPDNVSLEHAALADPLACALHAARSSRFSPGDNAVIIGAGTIGLALLQFLKLEGAGRVIVLEISPEKSRIARDLEADAVLDPLDESKDLTHEVLSLTGGIGADVVYECAGVPAAFLNSMNYVQNGGQVIIVGINDTEIPFNLFKILISELEIKGVLGFYQEFEQVIELMGQDKINADILISDIIALEEIEEKGFKRLCGDRDLIKVLVRP